MISFLKNYFIYLFLERGKGREEERARTSMCGCLSCTPYWGPDPQPRHVPWLGTEPVTLWFTSLRSIHRATPGRAPVISFSIIFSSSPGSHVAFSCLVFLVSFTVEQLLMTLHHLVEYKEYRSLYRTFLNLGFCHDYIQGMKSHSGYYIHKLCPT